MSLLLEKTYSKILTIELKHLTNLSSTVSIFEENAQLPEAHCCLTASNPIELAHTVRQFWENQTNSNCEPKVLCINHSDTFEDHMPQHRALLVFGILGAPIEKQFKAQLLIRTKQKPANEPYGTRVFQKLAHPPFYEPERNFFPAKAILSSPK